MPESREKIRAVVFDLDDTLYAERDYVLSGYRAVARQLGLSGPEAGGDRLAQEFEAWLWRRFLGGQSRGAFDALNSQFRLGLDAHGIFRLVEAYRSHTPDIRPAAGVPEMLGRLHARFRLALLTDGYMPAQQLKLDALNLRRFFDLIVFTEDLGRSAWKPAPTGFEMVQARLQLTHESLAYVGDNPAKDFVAPNRLGWLTVQVIRPGQIHARRPAPPDGRPMAVVHSPGELYEAILEHGRGGTPY